MNQSRPNDHPISDKQLALAEWLADYKRVDLPPECCRSKSAWFKFMVQNLGPLERDIANTARCDYGLQVDFDNPASQIGAIKYLIEAERTERRKKELQTEAVRKQLISGVDIYSVAEQFGFSDDEVWRIVSRLEAEGYEISAV